MRPSPGSPEGAAAAAARNGVRLRLARRRDARAWHALQRSIYDEGRWFVGDGPPAEATLAGRLQVQPQHRGVVWLAERGGALVGWCEVGRLHPERLQHVALVTIAVAAGERRRGVGSALMAQAEAWGREQGVRKLSLHVRSGNAGALALYRHCGYVVEGVERGQVNAGEGFEDNLIMAKHLVAPEAPA